MTRLEPGYRSWTGHEFTAVQAETYNRAAEKATKSPTEANLNGAHNLFHSISMTGRLPT